MSESSDHGQRKLQIVLRSPHDIEGMGEDFNQCLTYQAAGCKRSHFPQFQFSAYGAMAYTGTSTEIFEREDCTGDYLRATDPLNERPWNPMVFQPDYCFLVTLN